MLFRSGLGAGGIETFTPRTVIYDLKGGFGSLRKINALYDTVSSESEIAGLWDGLTANQRQAAIPPSRYQTLLDQGLPTFQLQQSDVRYWSDFNRIFYHPRSAVQINEYELHSQLSPFESWTAGEELFRDLDREVDLLDRDVRPFVEECDQMQGLQLISGTDDAWGGFAARYLDSLRDEYGKSSMWVWGVQDTMRVGRQQLLARSSNVARSTAAFGQNASVYVPLATRPRQHPSYLGDFESGSEWLTSALQCVAFESATLPARLVHDTTQDVSLTTLESLLNTNGKQNIQELQISGVESRQALANGADDHDLDGNQKSNGKDNNVERLDISFLPGQEQAGGARHIELIHTFAQAQVQRSQQAPSSEPALSSDERMRRRMNEESIVETFNTNHLFPLLDSFPDRLFHARSTPRQDLGVRTALGSATNVRSHLLRLRDVARIGVSVDERESLYNELSELANGYNYGYDSGTDEGEDE